MDPAKRGEKARSFGAVASHYERARPGYPDEALHWLCEQRGSKVIDLGAGTGKLARHLARRGHLVMAVEPSMPMLEHVNDDHAPPWAVCAVAEAVPVETGWADVVTSAQAFHWFDLERALPEIHRVLRPGGRLGLIWNRRDESVGWVGELTAIIGRSRDDRIPVIARRDRYGNDPSLGELTDSPLFGAIEYQVFDHHQTLRPDDLLSLVMSSSTMAMRSKDERTEVIRAVETLCREHPDLQGRQSFTLPYRTLVYRTPRRV